VRACVDLAPRGLTGTGLCFVGTSVDGLEDTHNAIRGRDDAFERTMENVRLMAKLRDEAGKRFPMIHVTAVIQDENLEELPGLPAVVAEAGASVLNLTMEIRIHSIEGLGDVDPDTLCPGSIGLPQLSPGRLDKYIEQTLEAADRAGIEVRLPDMPRSQILKYHDGGLNLEEFTCRGVWTNFYVGALGDVFPCFIYKVGNAREQRLKELWNGPKMRAFRQRLRMEPFCLCQGCCHLEYSGPSKGPSPHQHPGSHSNDAGRNDS
ncbi:MAG: hypothetical protein GY851_24945, partial [bacterium]|nr:hypothetical protein [bacterium]